MIKVDNFHQLIYHPWKIITPDNIDGFTENNISTITRYTSENNISKYKTSQLQNPIQIIKVSSFQHLMNQPCEIFTASGLGTG